MTTLSASVGESLPAHGLHYAMVLLGLWGLGALLLPHALDRYAARPTAPPLRDQHDLRVAALRAAVADGSLTEVRALSTVASPGARPPEEPAAPAYGLPLALVATAAAAAIHAAVAPSHLRDSLLLGTFFLAVALVQIAWTASLLARPTAGLMRSGIALNVALIGLWAITRTVGLPFDLLPGRHPVGGWDIVCVLWEAAAAYCCLRLLERGVPARFPGWFAWHPTSRAAVGAAATALVLLTVWGAHS